MQEFFPYQAPVAGSSFVGRTDNCSELRRRITEGGNALIYDIPKSGKSSLVRQALSPANSSVPIMSVLPTASNAFGAGVVSCLIDLVSVTSGMEFIIHIAESVMRSLLSSPAEYESAAFEFLSDGHFSFDAGLFCDTEHLLSISSQPDANDILLALTMGDKIASKTDRRLVIILDNFHIASRLDDCNALLRALSTAMSTSTHCSWVILGSRPNEMASMFAVSPLFSSCLNRIRLSRIPDKAIISYINSNFDRKGKVIMEDVAKNAILITGGNMWYLNHLMSICDSLTRGYVTQAVLMQATQNLLFIHDVRFRGLMDSLTFHQMSFLKAMIDGVSRFTGKKIIEQYSLNSSANIVRVKDALAKKEIIIFDSDGAPSIQDPLMDYWLRHSFFKK